MATKGTAETLLDAAPDKYGTILIDPLWRFANNTGKVAPEHKRLHRYATMSFEEITGLRCKRLGPAPFHFTIAEICQGSKKWPVT